MFAKPSSFGFLFPDGVDISITTALLAAGAKYRLSCDVEAPGRRLTTVSESFIVNIAPYGGDCTIDRTVGGYCLLFYKFLNREDTHVAIGSVK